MRFSGGINRPPYETADAFHPEMIESAVRFSVAIRTVFIINVQKEISVPLKGTSKTIIHLKRYIFIQIRNVHLKLANRSSCFVLQ